VKVWLVWGLAIAFAPGLHAQDGLRSASLPERPIATPPPGRDDLFRAGPRTYRPRDPEAPRHGPRPPLHPPPRPGRSSGWWYWPDAIVPGDVPDAGPAPIESAPAGSLQLRVEPAVALVYIDGFFAGSAADLRADGARLRAGVHRVRVDAAGFQTLTFDIRITPGTTVTSSRILDHALTSSSQEALTQPAIANHTLYVIPRCYAGDRPPDAASGCDLTQLHTIR
jgi:hypothetical protein